MPDTAPIFAPDGTLGDIPTDQLAAAVKAGAKPGVHMIGPDGKPGIVPADRSLDAIKAGAKLVPFTDQPIQNPGFWDNLISDLKGMAHGAFGTITKGPLGVLESNALAVKAVSEAPATWVERKQAGYNLPYRVTAPAGTAIGVNVGGMEQAAAEGDIGGVAGHAAAVPTAMAVTAGVARGAPLAADVARSAATAARPAVGAALRTAGDVISPDLVGVLSPRLAHAQRLAQRLGRALQTPQTVYPGAPLPEYPGIFPGAPNPPAPAPELLQAGALQQGGAVPAPEPSAALGNIPVRQTQPRPTYPGAPNPLAPSPELLRAAALQKPGAAVPDPAAGLGNVPVRSTLPAPTPPETQPTITQPHNRAAMPVHGESALADVLTHADQATLLRIAKSRGINVSTEAQLRAGVSNPRLIKKIIEDFSPDELEEISAKYLDAQRNRHQFAPGLSDEFWNTLTMDFYFPNVKIPAAMMKRAQASMAASRRGATGGAMVIPPGR